MTPLLAACAVVAAALVLGGWARREYPVMAGGIGMLAAVYALLWKPDPVFAVFGGSETSLQAGGEFLAWSIVVYVLCGATIISLALALGARWAYRWYKILAESR